MVIPGKQVTVDTPLNVEELIMHQCVLQLISEPIILPQKTVLLLSISHTRDTF